MRKQEARPVPTSLRGGRFTDALVPIDSESFPISNDLDELSQLTLVHGAGDSSLVGYTRYLASDGSFRVRARFLSSTAFADGVACNDAKTLRGPWTSVADPRSRPGNAPRKA